MGPELPFWVPGTLEALRKVLQRKLPAFGPARLLHTPAHTCRQSWHFNAMVQQVVLMSPEQSCGLHDLLFCKQVHLFICRLEKPGATSVLKPS